MRHRKLLTVIYLVFAAAAGPVFSQSGSRVTLSGSVTDAVGGVIAGARLKVHCVTEGKSASGTESVLISPESGQYKIEVAPGICHMEVDAGKGFALTSRGPFRLRPRSQTIINFQLSPDYLEPAPYDGPAPAVSYDHPAMIKLMKLEKVTLGRGKVATGEIGYASRKVVGNRVQYTTHRFRPPGDIDDLPGTTFSYNLFAVRADKLELDKRHKTITVTGRIMTDINGLRTTYTRPLKLRIVGERVIVGR